MVQTPRTAKTRHAKITSLPYDKGGEVDAVEITIVYLHD